MADTDAQVDSFEDAGRSLIMYATGILSLHRKERQEPAGELLVDLDRILGVIVLGLVELDNYNDDDPTELLEMRRLVAETQNRANEATFDIPGVRQE